MKSIKEKAKEFGILNPDILYDADGNTYDDVDKPSMDFEDGANYVLDEIVEFMQDNPHVNFESYKAIKDKIEQLKK